MKQFPGSQVKKVAVFRALKLGDMLCAIPALRALRNNFPSSKITLIGLPWSKEFADRFKGYINSFIKFPGYPGLPEQKIESIKTINFIKRVQDENFDLVFQMHGSGIITNHLTALFGGKITSGYYYPGNFCPDKSTFFPYPAAEREVDKNINLLRNLGLSTSGTNLEFPLCTDDFSKLDDLYKTYDLKPGEYVCIHPGSISAKSWDLKKFAKVGDNFTSWGYKVVLTGISGEKKVTHEVYQRMKIKPVDLAGKTTLGTLAALLKNSYFLISNDTGVSHLADALDVPSVVIFTNSNPGIWAPANRLLHKVVLADERYDLRRVLREINLTKGSN